MLCLCSFACSVCVRSLGGLEKCVGKCWYMGRVVFVVTFPEILELCDAALRAACVWDLWEVLEKCVGKCWYMGRVLELLGWLYLFVVFLCCWLRDEAPPMPTCWVEGRGVYMGRVLEFVGTFPEILELCVWDLWEVLEATDGTDSEREREREGIRNKEKSCSCLYLVAEGFDTVAISAATDNLQPQKVWQSDGRAIRSGIIDS